MSTKLHLDITNDSERLIALHESIYSLQLSSISMLDADRNVVLSDSGTVTIQLSGDGGETFKQTKEVSASSFNAQRINCFGVTHIKLTAASFTAAKYITIKASYLSCGEFNGKHNSQDISELLALFSEKPTETTLQNLGSAQSAGVGAKRVLVGSFAADVTSILLTSIPDATYGAVWRGVVTSVTSPPAASLFPDHAIIEWNKVAS